MRTWPGSSGVKSSVLPPSVLVNLKDMRRASSPMRDDETCSADHEPRAFGSVEVSRGGDDGNVGHVDTDHKRERFAHRVDPPRPELRTGTDQRDLDLSDPPAAVGRPAHGLTEQLGAVDALGRGIARREQSTDVAETDGGQNRRCGSMHDN